jgi:hypothetical protein
MAIVKLDMLDREVIESVLRMESGYVLDFSDRTFAEFFNDFDVCIDDDQYRLDGNSKANRLRVFLRQTPHSTLLAKVLQGLLDRRLLKGPPGVKQGELERFQTIISRLAVKTTSSTETDRMNLQRDDLALPTKDFNSSTFDSLPFDRALTENLINRMEEAHRCLTSDSFLATVILCGSVLEGLFLGFGSLYPERLNRAFISRYNKESPPFQKWRLAEWITVLGHLGDLTPNVEKFSHALRDFRNYVHPNEQISNDFSPDKHTAQISLQVVYAAADELALAFQRLSERKP